MRAVGPLLVALAFVAGCSSSPSGSPESLGLLTVPPLGETIATELTDGRPVFVVRHEDGQVDVLNALSPRAMSAGLGILLAWCPERRVFVDRSSGAAFDEFGSLVFGPSSSGMVRLIYGGGVGPSACWRRSPAGRCRPRAAATSSRSVLPANRRIPP